VRESPSCYLVAGAGRHSKPATVRRYRGIHGVFSTATNAGLQYRTAIHGMIRNDGALPPG